MIILGLTGSIGMGKSTCSAMLREQGVPVHDADQTVHDLLTNDPTTQAAIIQAFPTLCLPLDRRALRALVFSSPQHRHTLEAILHPRVQDSQAAFIHTHKRRRTSIVALDIPLLYETGADSRVDYTVVVSAPYHIQAQRVLNRPGMTEAVLSAILKTQLPDADKCKRADFVIPTGLGKAYSFQCVQRMLMTLKKGDIHVRSGS